MPDGSRSIDPGDRAPRSLSAVYRAHSAYVWRVLRHCGVPDHDLDDAVQETFLVVFRRLSEFEGRASLRTWIYAVAVRVASTHRRSQQREARRRDRAGAQMHGASVADPEAALSRAEAANLVDQLLTGLDSGKRTVFVLAEIEGIAVPEISRILGINPRTVHSRLRLARERFGVALRRMHAKEHGNRRTARLRPRALLDDAANERPSARRRTAVCAAVSLRIKQGAMPQLSGWETVAVGSHSISWGMPVAIAGAALVCWAAVAGRPPPAPPVTPPSAPSARSNTPRTSAPHDAPLPTDPPLPADGPRPLMPASIETGTPPTRSDHAPVLSPTPRRAQGPDAPPTRDPPPAESPIDPVSTLAEETRLLERARVALRRGDTSTAIAATAEHLKGFPRGLLLDEARSTRLRSLCAAGRHDEATALAHQLSTGATRSKWHEVVAASCPRPRRPTP